MAGQAPSRRQLLQALAYASAASGAPGFVRWGYAFAAPQTSSHHHSAAAPDAGSHGAATYAPRFFTPPEYAKVELLAETILPRTGTSTLGSNSFPLSPAVRPKHHPPVRTADAGAADAGVAEFIDFMVAEDATLHDPFRAGLLWLDASTAPRPFLALSPDDRTKLLNRLAFRRNFVASEQLGQVFFSLFRRYTVMGFYTTRIGLEQLGFPGLQFYGESPAVPHDGSLEKVLQGQSA